MTGRLNYLTNSEDLRTRIALFALAELADRAAAALAGRSGMDALTALGGVYRDHAREHPGRYAAAQYRLAPPAAGAGLRHAELARAVLRGYDLPEPDQTHAVRLLGSVFHGHVSLEMNGAFSHSAPGTDVTWQRILEALDSLLRHWPAPAGRLTRVAGAAHPPSGH